MNQDEDRITNGVFCLVGIFLLWDDEYGQICISLNIYHLKKTKTKTK